MRIATSVIIVLLLAAWLPLPVGPVGAYSTWLEGFGFRKEIVVNQTAGAGSDFQLHLTLHWGIGDDDGDVIHLNGKAASDFGDVRFSREDHETLLSYYLSNITSGISAEAWVKLIDDLDADESFVYLYYGNDTASSVADADATFIEVVDGLVFAAYYDETSGTSLEDSSTYANEGSLVGNPTWSFVDGYRNGGIQFQGDGWARFPDISAYDMYLGFTAMAWVNHSSSLFYPLQRNTGSSGYFMEVLAANAGQQGWTWVDGFGAMGVGQYAGHDNEFFHFALIRNSTEGSLNIIVNGTTVATATPVTGNTTTVGANLDSGAGGVGLLDEVLLFNETLTESTISNLGVYFPDATIIPYAAAVRKWLSPQPDFVVGVETAEPVAVPDVTADVAALYGLVIVFFALAVGVAFTFMRVRRNNRDE